MLDGFIDAFRGLRSRSGEVNTQPEEKQLNDGNVNPEKVTSDSAVQLEPDRDSDLHLNVNGETLGSQGHARIEIDFARVGGNWHSRTQTSPVAVLFGFDEKIYLHVAEFLADFRVVFIKHDVNEVNLKVCCRRFRASKIIIWRGLPNQRVLAVAKRIKVPIVGMNYGPLGRPRLGRGNPAALSYVFDDSGAYSPEGGPSTVCKILAEQRIVPGSRIDLTCKGLLKILVDARVSGNGSRTLQSISELTGPRIGRRVLVLGKECLESDREEIAKASRIDRTLIDAAAASQSGTQVIYRPAANLLFASKGDPALVANLGATLVGEEVSIVDLLASVDAVYVFDSEEGVEALLHGLPLFVFGQPFYAGWGLTIDMAPIKGERKTLRLEEFFHGVCLVYPTYVASPDDQVTGFLATLFRETADQVSYLNHMVDSRWLAKHPERVARSAHWPALFRKSALGNLLPKYQKKFLAVLSLPEYFGKCHGYYFQLSLAYFLVGRLRSSQSFLRMLDNFRSLLRGSNFAAVIEDLWKSAPSPSVLRHWAWLSEQDGDYETARRALSYVAWGSTYEVDPQLSQLIPEASFPHVLELAQFELRRKNFDVSYRLCCRLLLSGCIQPELFFMIAEVARLRFDFGSAAALLGVLNGIDPGWKLGRGWFHEARARALARDGAGTLRALSVACMGNPQLVESLALIEDVLASVYGNLPYASALLAASELSDTGTVFARCKALVAQGRPGDAESLIRSHHPSQGEIPKYTLTLSLALSYQGRAMEAKDVVSNALKVVPNLALYREAIRLAVILNDYAWGQEVIEEAGRRNLDVGEIYQRKIALRLGDIKASYLTFRQLPACKVLHSYLSTKYVQALEALSEESLGTNLVLAFFGPGDEIRFASLYRAMCALCVGKTLTFTCDPRLQRLLERHYTDLRFVPVARVRSLAWLSNYEQHDELPGSDLHLYADNVGWRHIQSASKVILVTDAVGDVVNDYSSFSGQPYLKADGARTVAFSDRLNKHRPNVIIGLSWRSSLMGYSRSEHYVDVEQLAPLFTLDGAIFVNLQYDECSEELEWVEQRYPGRLINFSDLDQFNDLDGVAALMVSLDLVVAPATTVAELAGALGCRTLLLSNSSELHWRKMPGSNRDVWHSSMQHVEGGALGDKQDLIANLTETIRSFIDERSAITIQP